MRRVAAPPVAGGDLNYMEPAGMNFAAARRNMVNSQILTNRVTHPQVIEALEQVPRELFVPKQWRATAYIDDDIDLGAGRYLMEPMVFARLLQCADIRPTAVVLATEDDSW